MTKAEFDYAKLQDVRAEIEHLTAQMNRRGWDMPGSSFDPRTRFERLSEAIREWTFFEQVCTGIRDYGTADLFPWEV